MIDEEKYQELLDSGLMLDHYFILCNIKQGKKLLDTRRVQGFVNLLVKKDYIEEGALTEKGLDMVQNCEFSEIISPENAAKEVDLGTWIAELHAKCQKKIMELTGSKQVRAKLNGVGYAFLPSATDLGKVIYKVIKMYKLTDYDKIEKLVLNHIQRCSDTKNWFPLLKYYIGKSESGTFFSTLAADMENDIEETDDDFKSTQKFL